MSDYIKREDAIASIMAHDLVEDGDGSREWAEHLLESATIADVVEVVRCKDCMYMHANKSNGQLTCNRRMLGAVRPNDYCSLGAKMDGEER